MRITPTPHPPGSELLFLGPVVRRKVRYVTNPRWERFRHGELVDKHGKPRRRGDACVAPTPSGYAEYDEERPARLVSFHDDILSVCFLNKVYQGPRKALSMKTILGFLTVALFLSFPSDALEARSEDDHVKEWCTRNNGEIEYHFKDRTRVDCLTSTHAVEFKLAEEWQDVVRSVGQVIHYARMAERRPGIVLVVRAENECKWVQRLEEDLKGVSVNGNSIQLWVVGPGESHCPLTRPIRFSP